MEDMTNQHGSGERKCENTKLVRRKNLIEMGHEKHEVKEYCQFVDDNTIEEPEGTCGVIGDTAKDSFQTSLHKDSEERLYKNIITALNLVEGTPERKVYFQNNRSYMIKYLKGDKDQYEKEIRWRKVKTATDGGDQAQDPRMMIKSSNKELPGVEEEGYETDGRKILELLCEYDSRKVRLKTPDLGDTVGNHAEVFF